MKYPVPNKDQEKLLYSNGIDPKGVFIVYACEEYIVIQNYKTGDEITVRPGLKSQRLNFV